jgi:hypothetical protein
MLWTPPSMITRNSGAELADKSETIAELKFSHSSLEAKIHDLDLYNCQRTEQCHNIPLTDAAGESMAE